MRQESANFSYKPVFYGLLLFAVLGLAAGFQLFGGNLVAPASSKSPVSYTITTSSPIVPSQCVTCHAYPGDTKTDTLIFKHSAHRQVACSGCHREYPHTPTGLKKPEMSACFTCHGMAHAPKGGKIASGECKTCHPDTAPKVPADHTAEWKSGAHKTAPISELRTCGMCHKGTYCEDCHNEKGVKKEGRVYSFEPVVEVVKQPGISITIGSAVTMSQCSYCHRNIDDINNPKLVFKHDIHLSRSISCSRCHSAFPHSAGDSEEVQTVKPPMELCYGCHGIIHNNSLIATDDCRSCHPEDLNLKPASHTPEFETATHPDEARKNAQSCEICHKASFCAACHTENQVIAKNHGMGKYEDKEIRVKWQKSHGREMESKDDCWICHEKSYCTDCHKTDVPHAVTWLGTHGKESKGRRDCGICHQNEKTCQDCHHGSSGSNMLTKDNCLRCHSIYKDGFKEINTLGQQAKADQGGTWSNSDDSRYYRGSAVHAAHFKLPNGETFSCQRCHGETIKQGPQYYPFQTLCTKCHGAYKNGKLIARYDVPELCGRCHSNAVWLATQ